jgi:hypothetical protein
MESAALPTLDALLAKDGTDVGTALPTEVWVTSSQGTLRCWSEGAKLRLAKVTDATAAPANAVLIAFKDVEAEREVFADAASGAKTIIAAVAAGKISVRGDVMAMRPAAERIVAALQRGAPIGVDAPETRTDGVVVYAVRDGDRRAARRYREFRALRKELVGTENCHARNMLKIPFPVKGPVLQPERRRRALDAWLRRVAALPLSAEGNDAVRAFAGDDNDDVLDARLAAVEKRALEPELAAARLLGAAVMFFSRAFAFGFFVMVVLLVAWLALLGSFAPAVVIAVTVGLAYDYIGLYKYCYRIPAAMSCLFCWKLARYFETARKKDGDFLDPFSRSMLASTQRSLAERVSVRLIGEVVVRLARLDKGLLVKVGQVLASGKGALADELVEPLSSLCDDVGAMPLALARRKAQKAPRAVRAALLASDLARPVASASIAQVHKVGDVAVKIQKPGVRHAFWVDKLCLKFIARLVQRLEPAAPDLCDVIESQYVNFVREMDFGKEAAALTYARSVLSARGHAVIIPEPLYEEALTDGILCMRWVQGAKISAAAPLLTKRPREFSACITALVDAHACLLFHGGIVHMDPHPGNVLIDVRADAGVPVLLDWGMHQRLDDAQRLGIAGIMDAVVRGDGEALPALYANLGVKLSVHVPASMILHFWKFVLRPATTDLSRDVGAIESFLEGHGDRTKELQEALKNAGGNQGPIATGLGPLLGTVRSLDLLHGFVLALPVSVDFLGVYARRACEALDEAR